MQKLDNPLSGISFLRGRTIALLLLFCCISKVYGNVNNVCPIITITNPSTTSGAIGVPFNTSFTQTGGSGTVTFTLDSGTLPTGITLSSSGTLSGTSTQSGSFLITVKVTDANLCTGYSNLYNLVIACPTITVSSPANKTAINGTLFNQTFTQTGAGSGANFSIGSGTLPNGLTLSNTGVLSGTPQAASGTYPITVLVTDNNSCTGVSNLYNLVVNCQTITIGIPSTTTNTMGVAFNQTFTQTGGIGSITFTTSNILPAGITLSTTGALSGYATQPGTFPIIATATDANGCAVNGNIYTLVVTLDCSLVKVNNISNQNFCKNTSTTAINFAGSINGTVYSWTNNTTSIGLAASGIGNIPSFTATNTTNAPVTATITVTPKTSTVGSAKKILLVYADNAAPTTLQSQLLALPGVTNVDLFNAGVATPPLVLMQQYNVVVPFSNTAWFDAATLGNNLADYLDANGIVVATTFSFNTALANTLITGRWSTGNYSPFIPSGTVNFTTGNLGTYTSGHPLMQGVSTLTAFFRQVVVLSTGATQIAAWNGASPFPLIATKGRVVGISAYLGNSPLNYSGDFAKVIVNAGISVGSGVTCTGTPKTFSIIVHPTPQVTIPINTVAPSGTAFSENFTETNGINPITFTTTSTLPSGFSLSASGVLHGTTSQYGYYPIIVKATDTSSCAANSSVYPLTVTISLPVTGVELFTSNNSNNALLNWKTNSEINSSLFIIERSIDNIHFTTIDSITAAGNSYYTRNYSFTDDRLVQLQNDIIYYRVKQIDKNGNIIYSNTSVVRMQKNNGLTVWPNPFTSSITIQYNSNQKNIVQIKLMDIAGRTLISKTDNYTSSSNQIKLNNLYKLGKGIYFIEVSQLNSSKKTIYKLEKN